MNFLSRGWTYEVTGKKAIHKVKNPNFLPMTYLDNIAIDNTNTRYSFTTDHNNNNITFLYSATFSTIQQFLPK